MQMYTPEQLKEKALENIVKAIMELEEHGELHKYRISLEPNYMELTVRGFTSFCLGVRHDIVTVEAIADYISLKRAKSEEEYFQFMCLDDMYCDEEIEKGIKELMDLYLKTCMKEWAFGGFLEGAYEDQ